MGSGKRRHESEDGEVVSPAKRQVSSSTSAARTKSPADAGEAPAFATPEEAEEAARYAAIAARAEAKARERAKARADNGSAGIAPAAATNGTSSSNGASANGGGGGGGSGGNGGSSSYDQADSKRRRRDDAASETSSAAGDKRHEPLSLEELLARKKEEEAARTTIAVGKNKVSFVSKKEREAEALRKLAEKRQERKDAAAAASDAAAADRGTSFSARYASERRERDRERERARDRDSRDAEKRDRAREKELELIRQQYLGGVKPKRRIVKPSEKFSRIFQFDWDATEDTSTDLNPLYKERARVNALFGRGYIAGIDMQEQRKASAFQVALVKMRNDERRRIDEEDKSLSREERLSRERRRRAEERAAEAAAAAAGGGVGGGGSSGGAAGPAEMGLPGRRWDKKRLEDMTERDWRIFREDFDINIKGGRAPLPLRYWEEGGLPTGVTAAIKELGYEHPTPIQRQTIPIGMQRRDLIGIAETGSGKTAAFAIPMIAYIEKLPEEMRERVAEDGPLALIMAPTRELAQQIEEECRKFCRHCGLVTLSVVGGQPIEEQGVKLRSGVHVVVGTPGRLMDCLETRYLVLNQCNYVVLDEADRMIDMGFEPQVVAVMDAMGGSLKSENETEAWDQEAKAAEGRALYRVTSMFSATMPPEVAKIASKYLRHPAVVQIGDEDTGKNRRIHQRVLSVPEAQKRGKLLEILRSAPREEKFIVFVNTKKSTDLLARHLEEQGYPNGVLHGGKTQDQREANLEDFRSGNYNILVATDVASRGLDIPDVGHVVNFELPNNIETYSHRIGRTGRAGKEGLATSFMTGGENEKDVLYNLKMYLISTKADVPLALANDPNAQAPPGARRDDGKLVGERRDAIQFSKR